jgi:prepilin-type N-terminal cleavage/methylation domain-containing protein
MINQTRSNLPRFVSAKRKGFSLAELLVGMAIIALLAAVLIPAVTGQIAKSDATRTLQDISSMRTGVEQFVADVRRYPGKLSHLTRAITVADRDVNGVLYSANLVARWKGPYVARDTSGAAGGFVTGYGAVAVDSLVRVIYQPGVNYVTIRLAGITQADFDRMDVDIDGSVNALNGVLRWVTGAASGVDTVKFLALPIQ